MREARLRGIFVVFFILEVGGGAESVLDIRKPIFDPKGGPPTFQSYMDNFPFPYYIILRDFNRLPEVLSDAMRQWFELVNSSPSSH